jgi:hypothetical protein
MENNEEFVIGKFYKENNILGVYVYYYNPVHA